MKTYVGSKVIIKKQMKLFLIDTEDFGYDEWDAHVVAAHSKSAALKLVEGMTGITIPV